MPRGKRLAMQNKQSLGYVAGEPPPIADQENLWIVKNLQKEADSSQLLEGSF